MEASRGESWLGRLILRWIAGGLALVVAAWLVPGIEVSDSNAWVAVAVMALVLGLVNAIIRPILAIFSIPLVLLTLGLFLLVVNALAFALASWIAVNLFHVGFYVHDFWSALIGSLIVSIVSTVLSGILVGDKR